MIFGIAIAVPSVLIYYIIFFIFEIDKPDIMAKLVILGIPIAVTKMWMIIIDLLKIASAYRVIYHHREKSSISEMCRFFKVSQSGYYDFVKQMDIPSKDLPLAEKISETQQNVWLPQDTFMA